MKWKKTVGILYSLLATCVLSAQSEINQPTTLPCYSDEFHQHRLLTDPGLYDRTNQVNSAVKEYLQASGMAIPKTSLIIPVVVYIVHNNGPENITDVQVQSQMNALNAYFGTYGLQFCLATTNGASPLPGTTTPGIIRVTSAALTNLDVNTEHTALAATSTLPSGRYLRIWVVNNINGGTANGFSILPDVAPANLDGVVMDYNAFGDIATCGCTTLPPATDNGKILVHEVGHYLGLYHTFNGGCAGMNSADCDDAGDLVCDTPPVQSPNSGCTAINTCSESPDLPDDINNFMDYTNENCLNSFTTGQNARMHAMISLYRSQLVSSQNLTHTGINCNGGLLPGFTATSFAPCVGTTVTFTASAVPGVTYSWDFGDGTTGTGQVVTHTYTAALDPGSVVLTINNGTDEASAIQTILVENCSPIQNNESNWYFFDRNALSFGSGAPVYNNSAFANNTFGYNAQGTNEASAVQSDASGNLLFYTDGIHIWKNTHQLITSAMHGHHSAMDGVIIVPDPGNSSQYYVFTSDIRNGANPRGFKYSKVQVTGTTASMVPGQLNIPVTVPSGLGFQVAATTNAVITGEGITAVPYQGGYWIIASTLVNNLSQHFLVFDLTSSGLAYHDDHYINDLQSAVTTTHVNPVSIQMAPNGKRISFTSSVWSDEPDFVFDFDRCSATFSNPRILPVAGNPSNYRVEFSPDSRLLYGAVYEELFQFNLEPCTITQRLVGSIPSGSIATLQRGPDSKIYGTIWGDNHLVTIHRPNNLATASSPNACQYHSGGPAMQNGTLVRSGLPNMIDARPPAPYTNAITASVNQCSFICNTYNFSADVCAATYSWNFGDPASGAANTSTLANPVHTFTSAGTYTVTLTAGGVTTTTIVNVGISPQITGSLTICPQVSMTGNYNAVIPAGYTAIWSVSGGVISGLNNQPDLSVNWTTLPGTVTLTVTNTATGCVSQRTITVTQFCPVSCTCDISGSYTYLLDEASCSYAFKGMAQAPACLGAVSYSWDFGDGTTSAAQSPVHTFPAAGTYLVCVTVTATLDGSTCTDTYCKEIIVKCEAKCDCKDLKPKFKYEADKDCIIQFQGFSGAPACAAYTEYYWNFGDGTTSVGQQVGHAYNAAGSYDVCLKVVIRNDKGDVICSEDFCDKVRVDCKGECKCELKPTFDMVNGGDCEMTFTGYSGSPCANITAYEWYVNGSGPYIGQVFNYQFNVNTTYEICLNVKGYSGTDQCEKKICKEFFYTDCYPFPFGKSAVSQPAIELYPNPANDQVTVSYHAERSGKLNILLRQADGRVVGTYTQMVTDGDQRFVLDIPAAVVNGLIMVEITDGETMHIEKLMILRD